MKSIEEMVDHARNGKRGRIIQLACLAAVLAFAGVMLFRLSLLGVSQLTSIPSGLGGIEAMEMDLVAMRIAVSMVFVLLVLLGLGLIFRAPVDEVFRISKNDVLVEMWDRIKRLEERLDDAARRSDGSNGTRMADVWIGDWLRGFDDDDNRSAHPARRDGMEPAEGLPRHRRHPNRMLEPRVVRIVSPTTRIHRLHTRKHLRRPCRTHGQSETRVAATGRTCGLRWQ